MKFQKTLEVWVLFVILVSISFAYCGKAPIIKRSLVNLGPGEPNEQQRQMKPSKRTFCNAFTGCGKKRSDESVPTKDYEYDRESSIENSEDPIDDMARDILAEARLWEAFQARNSMRLPTGHKYGRNGRQKRSVDKENHGQMKESGVGADNVF